MKLESYIAQKRLDGDLGKEPKQRLAAIINKPLTPENVNVYFDNALNETAELADTTRKIYEHIRKHPQLSQKEAEDQAFSFFGLQAIPEILTLIERKRTEADEANKWLQSHIETLPEIIVPPSEQGGGIIRGSATFERPSVVNRLKTLLYILRDSDINLEEVRTKKGELSDTMMRKMSYVSVEVPSLHRMILVCDEEGNASYFFDTEQLVENNVDSNAVLQMTKEEIAQLIGQNVNAGTWLRYSENWTEDVRRLLHEPLHYHPHHQGENEDAPQVSMAELDPWRGFYEKEGQHYGSLNTIATKLGNLNPNSIHKSLKKDPLLSIRILSGLRQKPADGYSYEAVRDRFSDFLKLPLVAEDGEWEGFLEVRNEATGVMEHFGAAHTIGARLGINDMRIRRMLKDLQLPIVKIRIKSGQEVEGLCYERVVAGFANSMNLERTTESGEWKHFYEKNGIHYGAIGPIKNKLGATFSVIGRIIKNANLPVLRIESIQGKPVDAYSYEEVDRLYGEFLAIPQVARVGEWKDFHEVSGKHYGPVSAIARKLGVKSSRVSKVKPAENIKIRDFMGRVMEGYVLEDIEQLLGADTSTE